MTTLIRCGPGIFFLSRSDVILLSHLAVTENKTSTIVGRLMDVCQPFLFLVFFFLVFIVLLSCVYYVITLITHYAKSCVYCVITLITRYAELPDSRYLKTAVDLLNVIHAVTFCSKHIRIANGQRHRRRFTSTPAVLLAKLF